MIDVDESHAPSIVIILEIDNVTSSDEGTYKCVAKNTKGESSILVELKIDGKPDEKKPEDKKNAEKKQESKQQSKPEAKQPEIKVEAPAVTNEPAKPKSNEVAASFKEKPKDQVKSYDIILLFWLVK